jgi:Bacterial dnaA protein helix-turn-helix
MLSFRREELMRRIDRQVGIWRLSLEQIEATVTDYLGRGRELGSRAGPCFSRQISMYLAKYVGDWSAVRIGRFYNGRHRTTVLHVIGKIERLRRTDESVSALIEVLTATLNPSMEGRFSLRFEPGWSNALIETGAAKVLDLISGRLAQDDTCSWINASTRDSNNG